MLGEPTGEEVSAALSSPGGVPASCGARRITPNAISAIAGPCATVFDCADVMEHTLNMNTLYSMGTEYSCIIMTINNKNG